MPLLRCSLKPLKLAPFLLCMSRMVIAAPFEIKVHDELIAEYQESAYEVETIYFKHQHPKA